MLRVDVAPHAKIIKICHYEPIWTGEIESHLEMKAGWRNRKSHISSAVKLLPHWEVDIISWVVGTYICIVQTLSLPISHTYTHTHTHTHTKCMKSSSKQACIWQSMQNVHAVTHTFKRRKYTPSQPARCSMNTLYLCMLAEPSYLCVCAWAPACGVWLTACW